MIFIFSSYTRIYGKKADEIKVKKKVKLTAKNLPLEKNQNDTNQLKDEKEKKIFPANEKIK